MTVEIIGRACIAPGASSSSELFELLRARRSTVTQVPDERWDKARYWHPQIGVPGKSYTFAAGIVDDIMDFDPSVFGMSPREAASLDPQQRLVLRMVWRALEDAGLSPSVLSAERVGVYVGASSLEYGNLIAGDPASASPYFMTGNTLSIIANRVSHLLDVSGPSLTVDTACSSGLVALDLAVRALEAGEIGTAIVASVNVLAHPGSFVGFAQARMLSPAGQCRAYDNAGEGYVRAEGGAALVLRRSDRALGERDRSHARILATGVNSSGRTNGISLPSGEAQAALLRSIYSQGGIDPNRLAFLEGHGTGTRVGDPAEVRSIGTEIGQKRRAPIPIGSIKTNIGHTEPASGLMGLMKAMLALEHDYLPASLHFDEPNEHVDFVGLNVSVAADGVELLRSRHPRLAGVNSFGFGGTNAHVVIADPAARTAEPAQKRQGTLFFASAQTASSLAGLLSSYRARIEDAPAARRGEVLEAMSANRQPMRHRFAIASRDARTVVEEIDAFSAGQRARLAETGEALGDQAKTAFVFSGNGSQWAGMALDAHRHNAFFRDRFGVVDALFRNLSDLSPAALLLDEGLGARLADTRVAQPLLFATQVALADSLIDLGLVPSLVYGHSIGEVAAAYCSGAISLVEAVTVVARRSMHQHAVAGRGTMAAVSMEAGAALDLARAHGLCELELAAVNAPKSVTLSGPHAQIREFLALAASQRIGALALEIDYPFHHAAIDLARPGFFQDLPAVARRASQIPFVSAVTGGVLAGEELDPAYWWRNIREPVLFAEATSAAIEAGVTVFVEIGPRPVLSSYLREMLRHHGVRGNVLATLSRPGTASGIDPVGKAFARAAAAGAAFDAARALGRRDAFVEVPPLPFEPLDGGHAVTSEALDIYGSHRREVHTLLGWRADPSASNWRNHFDAHLYPDLAEHMIEDRAILPGSAFIEIVLQAGRRHFGEAPFEIANLEILRPIDLSHDSMLEVSTVLSPETGQVQVRSRERLRDDEWTLHAVARCRPAAGELHWRESRADGAGETIAAADIYRTTQRFGLNYGPRFRLLQSARLAAETSIEVDLAQAGEPANPFLSYDLDPVSTDAAFHGLVGLLDRVSASQDGAPYVPVRFGTVRLHRPGAAVRRALIEIEHASAHSIKAAIRLLDEASRPVATLFDCRFRRSFLKPHKSLEALAYHHEAVLSPLGADAAARPAARARLLPAQAGSASESSMLLEAAVYRACHDLASRTRSGIFSLRQTRDLALESFLTNCLHRLQETGLARLEGGQWSVEECALPPFEELVAQFLSDEPGRSTEAILLCGAYRAAHDRLDAAAGGTRHDPAGGIASGPEASDATLAYHLARAPSALARQAHLAGLVEETLGAAAADRRPPHVAEICAVSRAFSLQLAEAVARRGGRLTIVEANERLRNELELALGDMAHVRVLAQAEPDALGRVDLIVSTSDDLYNVLEADEAVRDLVTASVGRGGALLACPELPGPFSEFVFGLTEGWYARTLDPEFPLGRMASESDWRQLAGRLELRQAVAEAVEGEFGPYLSLVWTTQTAPQEQPEPAEAADDLVAASLGGAASRAGGLVLTGDEARDRAAVAALLEARPAARIVYDAQGPDAGAEKLADHFMALSAIVKEMALRHETRRPDDPAPRLAVLLPAGAPAAPAEGMEKQPGQAALSSGLWSFLRVVRNEYTDVEIHSLDLAGREGRDADRLAAAILDGASSNREWVLDAGSGALYELRVVPGPELARAGTAADYAAATLRQGPESQIAGLKWEAGPRRAPGPGEVVIEVAATALNYRDVMWAIGLLPEEALEDGFAGVSIGMECSGTIVATGSGVAALAVGDRVMAVAADAFSTHVVAPQEGVARLPDGMSLIDGATLPVAFLTAWYALVELGRLEAGETVLIHGGAGGVGLAALQIARARGAIVIATAGTPEKRRLLSMLGADHVLDSRSLDFVGEAMRITGEAGVDMVLNSLFGEAMERGLSLLKPFGRFLELGKRDYYADSKIGLRPFRRNISYFGIDADQLLKARPRVAARLFGELAALFGEGELAALPYRVFPYDEAREAFRLMQGSGHIGKILVAPPKPGADPVSPAHPAPLSLASDGFFLVVGGIGGFGLAAADWLVDNGARFVALCSRRGVADAETQAAIARWSAAGVHAGVHACDVTDEAAVKTLLSGLRETAPLRGVVHAAMVLDDALLVNLERDRVAPVLDAKARGAEILDRATRGDPLEHFILFSSVSALVGNPGQANYACANGFLEGLARARRAAGLPALAVGFGAIADVGYLAADEATKSALGRRIGKTTMSAREALDRLGEYVAADPGAVQAAAVVIAEMNWHLARSLATVASPLFEVVERTSLRHGGGLGEQELDLQAMVEGKPPKEAEAIVYDLLAKEIAATLRIPVGEIARMKMVRELGIDSLMALELGMNFRQKTGVDLALSNLAETATVGDIAQKLVLRLATPLDAPRGGDHEMVDRLAGSHSTAPGKAVAEG